MSDLLKLLDGSVDDVKAGLSGKSREDLAALGDAEKNGKNRKGVLEAIDALLDSEDASDASAGTIETGGDLVGAADSNGDNGIAPAEEIEASGAPHQIVPDVDMTHPAVDADPRANTTEVQNRIDFNDPVHTGREIVEHNLANQ